MANTCVGIDIGEKFTRLIDYTIDNNKININCMGKEPTIANFYSDDTEKSIDNQAEIISKLFSDLKITKKSANIIIPDNQSFSQVLEFPILNEKELLSAVKYQSDQFIPMPIEEVDLDIEILKEDKSSRKNTILIVASPKKIIERIEKTFDLTGIIPETIENELSSSARFMADFLKPQVTSSYIMLNFGYTSTSIYLFDAQTHMILLTRTVKIGFELFLKELRFNFELQETKATEVLATLGFEKNTSYDIATVVTPLMKELLTELSKIIGYAKENFNLKVSKIYIFSHTSYILSFDKKLSEALSLPVESMYLREVLVNNPVSQSYAQEMPSYICTIGSVLR